MRIHGSFLKALGKEKKYLCLKMKCSCSICNMNNFSKNVTFL